MRRIFFISIQIFSIYLLIMCRGVYAKEPRGIKYDCSGFTMRFTYPNGTDEEIVTYVNASDRKPKCCPKKYLFKKGICYNAGGFSVLNYTVKAVKDYQWSTTVPTFSDTQGACYYKDVPNVAPVAFGTCDPGGEGAREKDLYIHSDDDRDAVRELLDCGPRQCEGTEYTSASVPIPYCYDENDRTSSGDWCGCDCTTSTWDTLELRSNICPCVGDLPGNGNGNGDNPPPIQLTCAEVCDGERIDTDGDGETDQDGSHYSSCISCICAGTSSSKSFTGNVWTELGCITATQEGITVAVMRIFIGIVTGIAVIRFIQAGIMLNTDDPEQIKEGRSIAMSAVAAIIFGALIPILLNFIGLDILGIGKLF